MKPTYLTILLLTFFVVEIHSLPVLSAVWELLGGEDSQIKVNLTLTGTIEKVHKFYGLDGREPAVSLKLEEDETEPASYNDTIDHMSMQQETTPDTAHELSTFHTFSSEASEFGTTQQAMKPFSEPTEATTTPYDEPTATTTILYGETTEATTPYKESSTVAISSYYESYDDDYSRDSSEATNGHELTPNWGTTTQKPVKHECPTAFKLIDRSCFQVIPGFVTGYESADRCKQYARENNLPEDDVGLGMILNDKQNTAVHNLAMEKERVRELKKQLGYGEMMVGVWRPASGMLDDWKYMRNNQSVIYTNFDSDIKRLSNSDDVCVYQFLDPYQQQHQEDVGKWDDNDCNLELVAVLCEYKETTPHSIHELSTIHTSPSETSEFETTERASTPYSEPTETTTSPYGRKYDDSSHSSEETNGHGTTSTIGTTTHQPAKHECPTSFKLIDGSCFQVLPGLVTGYESYGRCKQYARENNLQEKDVGLGMILNDKQNTAVHNMAVEKTRVEELLRKHFFFGMLVGVWRPASGMLDDWKFMRNNQSVKYTNFDTGTNRSSSYSDDDCVYEFLNLYQSGQDVGKWNDNDCNLRLVAVLCEYKGTTPDNIHELSTYHTTPSVTSGFGTTKEETTPYSEATATTTSPYGRKYDDSSDSSEENEQGTTSTMGTTTTQPDEHECPADSFKLIGGSCFQVVPGVVTGYESSYRCKQYARDNNLLEEDVELGMIRNDEQNMAVYALAMRTEQIKELVNQYRTSGISNMWVGVWRTATEPHDSWNWKYMRNNQSVIYTNFATRIQRYTGEGDVCVYQFLHAPGIRMGWQMADPGRWDDLQCYSRKVAVLCEYKDPSHFVNSTTSPYSRKDDYASALNDSSDSSDSSESSDSSYRVPEHFDFSKHRRQRIYESN